MAPSSIWTPRASSAFLAFAWLMLALGGCGGSSPSLRGGAQLPNGILGRQAPAFRLTDARGGVFKSSELAGKPYLVTFLYAHCRTTCPLIAEEVREALAQLGSDAGKVAAVAVSVDPRGDTRTSVRRFLALHHEPSGFHYLIGTRARLAPIWKAYYVGPEPAGATQSLHTAAIWLVDRHGRWRVQFPAGYPLNPSDVSFDFQQLLRQS
jgi:protein SCO1/2